MVHRGLAQMAVRMMVMVMTVVMERLMGLWGDWGRTVGVLVVVVMMLAVWVIVSAGMSGEFFGVVWNARGVWVMVLLAVAVVVVMVMWAPVALKRTLLLQLLLDVRRWRVAVSCRANQGLHCVLWGQT